MFSNINIPLKSSRSNCQFMSLAIYDPYQGNETFAVEFKSLTLCLEESFSSFYIKDVLIVIKVHTTFLGLPNNVFQLVTYN